MVKRWPDEPGALVAAFAFSDDRVRYSISVCRGGLSAQAAIDAHANAARTDRCTKRKVLMVFCFPLTAPADVPGNQGLYRVPYSQ
jgi:hypothetical protein